MQSSVKKLHAEPRPSPRTLLQLLESTTVKQMLFWGRCHPAKYHMLLMRVNLLPHAAPDRRGA